MECAEFKAALIANSSGTAPALRGGAESDAVEGGLPDAASEPVPQHELAKHAATCAKCAESLITLAAVLSEVDDEADDSQLAAEHTRAIETTLASERGIRGWLRSRSTTWRRAAVLAVVALLTGALAIAAPRVDLAVYPAWRIALVAAVYGLALAALVWRALLPMHRLPAPGRDRAWLALGLALPFLVAALPPAQLRAAVSTHGQGHDCLALGVMFGLLFAVALRAFDRDLRPGMHGRWLALAGGTLTANAALLFHCPIARPLHGYIVHAGMIPLALLLVLLLTGALRAIRERATRTA